MTVIDYDRVGGNEPIGEKNTDFFRLFDHGFLLVEIKGTLARDSLGFSCYK